MSKGKDEYFMQNALRKTGLQPARGPGGPDLRRKLGLGLDRSSEEEEGGLWSLPRPVSQGGVRLDLVVSLCSNVRGDRPRRTTRENKCLKNIISKTLEFPSFPQQSPPGPPSAGHGGCPALLLVLNVSRCLGKGNSGSSSVIRGF